MEEELDAFFDTQVRDGEGRERARTVGVMSAGAGDIAGLDAREARSDMQARVLARPKGRVRGPGAGAGAGVTGGVFVSGDFDDEDVEFLQPVDVDMEVDG